MSTDPKAGADAVREALAELVACKDLKAAMADAQARQFDSTDAYRKFVAVTQEYDRRQPLAWEAARAALASTAQPSTEPTEAMVDAADGMYYQHTVGDLACDVDGRENHRAGLRAVLNLAAQPSAAPQAENGALREALTALIEMSNSSSHVMYHYAEHPVKSKNDIARTAGLLRTAAITAEAAMHKAAHPSKPTGDAP